MIVSTGVGGGLILGGQPFRGATGHAGHVGHVGHVGQIEVSGLDGEPTPGHSGTLEAVASGPKSVARARRQGLERDHR